MVLLLKPFSGSQKKRALLRPLLVKRF